MDWGLLGFRRSGNVRKLLKKSQISYVEKGLVLETTLKTINGI